MNILSWNIMSGGFDSYDSIAKKPERLNLLISSIKTINADFVSLVDTHRWTEVFSKEELKLLFGYENVYLTKLEDDRLKAKGHDNGVAVLTHLPIRSFETIRIHNRNAIKTSLQDIDIFTIYFDDISEDTRLQQCDSLLNQVTIRTPTIITGDLNTIDEYDLSEAKSQIEKMFIQHPEAKAMEPILKEMMRGEVTKKIKENGFIDIGVGKGNTVPTQLFPIKMNQPITRFDYSLCTRDIKVENYEVLSGVEFDQLSDHYPINFDVSLK